MDFFRSLFKDKDSKEDSQRLGLQEELNTRFPADNIRVLVYKDGGKLLYDSLSPPQAPPDKSQQNNPNAQRKSNIPKNQDMFGDLMLGTVPLTQDGVTTKVHHFQESNQVLVSKLFCIVVKRRVLSHMEEDDDHGDDRRRSQERAKTAPASSTNGNNSNNSNNNSNTTTPPRRTSVSASAYSVKPQRITYALGVVFTYTSPAQCAMIHTHFPIIDMRLKKMVRVLKNSFESRVASTNFSHNSQQMRLSTTNPHGSIRMNGSVHLSQTSELQQEIATFQHAVQTLYSAPRIEYPIWSAVSTATKGRVAAYTLFLNALKSLDAWDAGNGFLPTLVTGLLSVNLSWLRFLDLSELLLTDEAKQYLNRDRNSIYSTQNPLMFQLEDLYGFFGSKANISRTIILAEKGTPHLNEMLLLCSYFLRCTQINYPHTPESPGKLYPPPDEDSPASSPPISIIPTPSIPIVSSSPHSGPNSTPSSSFVPSSSFAPSSHSKANGHHIDLSDPAASWHNSSTTGGFIEGALPFSQNFSFSLYAGLYPGYLADMALSATSLSRDNLIPQILADMRVWMDHAPFCTKIQSTSCILANPMSRKCEVLTYCPSPSTTQPDELVQTLDSAWFSTVPTTVNREVTTDGVEKSEYIASTLTTVRELYAIGVPPEACIMFLEDRLRNVYIRSLSLLKHLKMLPCPGRLTYSEAADLIGCGTVTSDIHLLVAILESVIPPTSFVLSTRKEIGNWWLLVEPLATPATIPSSNTATAIQ